MCGDCELYDLALENNHIFFVTTQNIQTHNFGIDIFLAASFATLLSNWSLDMVSIGIAVAGALVTSLYNYPLQTIFSHAYTGPLLAWHIAKTVGKSIQIGATALVDTEKAQKELTEYTKPLSKAYRFLQESDAATLAHTASSLTVHMVIDGLIGSRLAGSHHKIINKALSACPKPVLITMTSGGDPTIPEKIISIPSLSSEKISKNSIAEGYYERFTPEVVEKSVEWTLHGNKMNHVLTEKHKLESFNENLELKKMFAKDLITELIKSEKLPAAGQNFFNTGIEVFVDQQKIEVKGIISKENIIKIGTCFVRTMEKEI